MTEGRLIADLQIYLSSHDLSFSFSFFLDIQMLLQPFVWFRFRRFVSTLRRLGRLTMAIARIWRRARTTKNDQFSPPPSPPLFFSLFLFPFISLGQTMTAVLARASPSWTGASDDFYRMTGLSSTRVASRSAATPDDGCCGDDASRGDIAPCNSHRRPPRTRHASSDARSSYRATVDNVSCRTWPRRSETHRKRGDPITVAVRLRASNSNVTRHSDLYLRASRKLFVFKIKKKLILFGMDYWSWVKTVTRNRIWYFNLQKNCGYDNKRYRRNPSTRTRSRIISDEHWSNMGNFWNFQQFKLYLLKK